MSYELFMEYYQQMQEILANNIFQEYGIIGLFAVGILASALKSWLGEDYDYVDKDGNKKNWDPTTD